jgi:hypothetical protein
MKLVFDVWTVEYTFFSALTSAILHFFQRYIYGVRFIHRRNGDYLVHSNGWLVFLLDMKSVSCEAGNVLAYTYVEVDTSGYCARFENI